MREHIYVLNVYAEGQKDPKEPVETRICAVLERDREQNENFHLSTESLIFICESRTGEYIVLSLFLPRFLMLRKNSLIQ